MPSYFAAKFISRLLSSLWLDAHATPSFDDPVVVSIQGNAATYSDADHERYGAEELYGAGLHGEVGVDGPWVSWYRCGVMEEGS